MSRSMAASRPTSARRDWKRLSVASGMALLAVTILLGVLVSQLMRELNELRETSKDNIQWSLAQLQVELLTLREAADEAGHTPSAEALAELRQRFDIFYSRIETLQTGSVFADVTANEKTSASLKEIRSLLDGALPMIDGSDTVLREGISWLERNFAAMQPNTREIALAGVEILARNADYERETFSHLLTQTVLLACGVILAMLLALFMLIWQFRIARQRSDDLQARNRLYESAINASLDAIVVSNEAGIILDFNPAAERLFGYTRDSVIGKPAENLIIPPGDRQLHRRRRGQLLQQAPDDILLSGRHEIDAMRADGEIIPVELSLGLTRHGDGQILTTYLRDISERRSAQQAMAKARDDALAMAKAKSDFLAVMSHEMRTPLNGVMGLLDMLSETRLTARQRDYVKTAITSGEILQRHIDDVLNINRVEAGVTRLQPTRFSVAPLLTELRKINEPAAKARGNRIETEISSGADSFVQDRQALRQVMINLVGNAVKFTKNGTILLKATRIEEDGSFEFSVSDTGIGISKEDVARIFDDFVMLDPSYKRTAPGSGLGLGISRRITELMGGTLGVTSEPGHGSRFFLRLPPLALPEAKDETTPAAPVANAAPGKAVSLSVLLVEDNETNRFVAREMLKRHGCRIMEATDGEEGVALAESTRFDLIFMDVSMPRLDGVAATGMIRNGNGPNRQTPIIGLTAHALPEDGDKFREAGMQEFILKPLRAATVSAIVARFANASAGTGEGQPAAEIAPTDLLDLQTLGELAEALPRQIFDHQLSRFVDELTNSRHRFCDAPTAESDLEELAACAHKMAGSAAVFGATMLRIKLIEVESAAKHGDMQQIPPLCASAHMTAEHTLAAIETFTREHRPTA
ncbi:response regulator [Martelella alba]|uniref:histidine kinase n=1 Tax=Martelella alba TaxID=2590451 RepID=A0A506UE85_9HYPH|nr:PAS domain-containing hybrid sensor histidine kinase/response regulator [Martelella alba]TPW30047.1 response regulator [Martelella alba]